MPATTETSQEARQCYICKTRRDLHLSHKETGRDKDTGKGYTVPRYICGRDRAEVDRRIKKTVGEMTDAPMATRLAILSGLKS